jgi:hypothetical protein
MAGVASSDPSAQRPSDQAAAAHGLRGPRWAVLCEMAVFHLALWNEG